MASRGLRPGDAPAEGGTANTLQQRGTDDTTRPALDGTDAPPVRRSPVPLLAAVRAHRADIRARLAANTRPVDSTGVPDLDRRTQRRRPRADGAPCRRSARVRRRAARRLRPRARRRARGQAGTTRTVRPARIASRSSTCGSVRSPTTSPTRSSVAAPGSIPTTRTRSCARSTCSSWPRGSRRTPTPRSRTRSAGSSAGAPSTASATARPGATSPGSPGGGPRDGRREARPGRAGYSGRACPHMGGGPRGCANTRRGPTPTTAGESMMLTRSVQRVRARVADRAPRPGRPRADEPHPAARPGHRRAPAPARAARPRPPPS